jgi:hypothetical protein
MTLETISKQNPFTKIRKIPNVRMEIGSVRMMRTGLMITFTTERTTAANKAWLSGFMEYSLVSLPMVYIEKLKIKNLIVNIIIS